MGVKGYEVKRLRPVEMHPGGRMKWSCQHCTKRNDTQLYEPVKSIEVHNCKFCKKPQTFTFKPKEEEEATTG